jgi:hypothetical protein
MMTGRSRRFMMTLSTGATVLSLGLWTRHAEAATITVNSVSWNTVAVRGQCDLPQAVTALNTQKAVAGCAAGNGKTDTIVVPVGFFAATSALTISRTVIIKGAGNLPGVGSSFENPRNGVVQTYISASGIPTAQGALFHVSDGGRAITVTVQGIVMDAGLTEVSAIWGDLGSGSTINVLSSHISDFGASGIFTEDFALKVENSQITNNSSTLGSATNGSGGGIDFVSFGDTPNSLTILNSTIDDNSADLEGGGIAVGGFGNSSITNSTIAFNMADDGGGIVLFATEFAGVTSESFNINTSTIASNNATGDAGGLHFSSGDNFGSVFINSSIISDNTSPNQSDNDVAADGPLTVSNSLVETGAAANPPFIDGGNNIEGVSAHLGSLEPRGGADGIPVYAFATLPVNPDQGSSQQSYELTVSSRAVDFLTGFPPGSPETDERGDCSNGQATCFPRGVSQFGGFGAPGTLRYDIGAYEFDPHMQAESMLVAAMHGVTPAVVTDTNFYNGQGVQIPATAAAQSVTYFFVSPADGCYHVWLHVKEGTNEGQFQLNYSRDLSGSPTAYVPWAGSAVNDLFATKTKYATLNLGYSSTALLHGTGYYFQVLVSGKNKSSSAFNLFIDSLDVVFEQSNGTASCTSG